MQINQQLIDKIAHLARLEFNNDEKIRIEQDLNRILSFIEIPLR
jgi:Asp-tRNA(Asn)/Glu-tRNA(Gln) amidotransferase C subunit